MNETFYRRIEDALRASWSRDTCVADAFDARNPSANQCAQTALLVQKRFGGEILRTQVRGDFVHIYNRIDGQRLDFTAEQFKNPKDRWDVTYEDEIVDRAEAMCLTTKGQLENLMRAFDRAFGPDTATD